MQKLIALSGWQRLTLLYRCIGMLFFIGVLLSLPLWHGQRLFPLIPLIPEFPALPVPFDYILAGLFLLLLLLNGIWIQRRLTIALLGFTALMIFFDQMRLQPWVFLYLLILIPFALVDFSKEKDKTAQSFAVLNYLQVLLVGVYCWSGLHKFTPSFIETTHLYLLKGLFRVPDGHWLLEQLELGYGAAAIEFLVGLGLVFPKTRNIAVLGATATHLLIIAWLSPVGGNTNYVVIPWNIAMIALVWLSCYHQKNRLSLWRPAQPRLRMATLALAMLVWVMPVLNLKEQWDAYLSFNLYTERISHLYVGLRMDALKKSDPRLSAYYGEGSLIAEGKVIDVTAWAFGELHVPVYPAPRVFRAIGRHFCKSGVNPDEIMLVTYRRPFREGHYEAFSCKDCVK